LPPRPDASPPPGCSGWSLNRAALATLQSWPSPSSSNRHADRQDAGRTSPLAVATSSRVSATLPRDRKQAVVALAWLNATGPSAAPQPQRASVWPRGLLKLFAAEPGQARLWQGLAGQRGQARRPSRSRHGCRSRKLGKASAERQLGMAAGIGPLGCLQLGQQRRIEGLGGTRDQ